MLAVFLHDNDGGEVANVGVVFATVLLVAQHAILPVFRYALDQCPIVLGQLVFSIESLPYLLLLLVGSGLPELQRQTKHELLPDLLEG